MVVADIGHFATSKWEYKWISIFKDSFGRLEIIGDSSLTGDVNIGGNINIGDNDTDYYNLP